MRSRGNIWAGCVILGVALGFVISIFTSYGVGMPIGTLLGVGAAFLLNAAMRG
jgi:F0F1-type ATP synthase membrane subunit a